MERKIKTERQKETKIDWGGEEVERISSMKHKRPMLIKEFNASRSYTVCSPNRFH